MHVCVRVCVYTCIYLYIETQIWCQVTLFPTLVTEAEPLPEPGSLPILAIFTNKLALDPISLPPKSWDYKLLPCLPDFCMGSHVWAVSSLFIKHLLNPVAYFSPWDRISCSPDWLQNHYAPKDDFELLIFCLQSTVIIDICHHTQFSWHVKNLICLYYLCVFTCAMSCAWRSEDNMQELALPHTISILGLYVGRFALAVHAL